LPLRRILAKVLWFPGTTD